MSGCVGLAKLLLGFQREGLMKHILIMLMAATAASAQLNFPGYLPQQCQGAATQAIPGTSDAKIIAISAAGIEFPIGQSMLYIGMDFTAGTAPIWFYTVYSESMDTVVTTGLVRLFGSCTPPPFDLPSDIVDIEELSRESVPSTYLEGTSLLAKLKSNGDYQAFAAAHPDSLPLLTLLTVSTEELFGFPIGTPFWAFFWFPVAEGSLGLTCLVEATSGQTVCFGDGTVGVSGEEARNAGYYAYPNPTTSTAVLVTPQQVLNSHVRIEAVSVTGQHIPLMDGVATSLPMFLNTDILPPGMWSLLIHTNTRLHVVPLIKTGQ